MNLSSKELNELCVEVRKIAALGANFISQELEHFNSDKIEYKGSDNDLVSYVDKETEKILVEELQKLLPQAGFVTEEQTVAQSTAGLVWVIDPLDGTTNFMHQLAPYSVSIALMLNKEVLLGVVHEVAHNQSFYAWKNGGAWCNEKKIHVSTKEKLAQSLVVVGFPYKMGTYKEAYFQIINKVVENSLGLRRLGSAAADLAYVACGKLDAYIEFNINIWDMAAGLIILEEAGGCLSDFNNQHNQRMGQRILATNQKIHAELLEIVAQYWNE
jgi:myo-inositol-1(or 4)-monophosphatase